MTFGIALLCFAVAVSLFYVLYRRELCRFSVKELGKSGISVGSAIVFYADIETLEYTLRCALAAAEKDGIPVTVKIPKYSKDKEEMLYILRAFRKKYKNLTYRTV